MNKKIREIELVANDTQVIGVFTIVKLVDKIGIVAVGISRCAKYDRFDKATGESIARGRAYKALHNKKNHKKTQMVYAG